MPVREREEVQEVLREVIQAGYHGIRWPSVELAFLSVQPT